MALTLTLLDSNHASDLRGDQISFAGEASYATGGSDFTALFNEKVKQSRTILSVVVVDCGGYVVAFDPATGKLKIYYSNSDAADGPLIEVPNATNLSAVTFIVLVLSK